MKYFVRGGIIVAALFFLIRPCTAQIKELSCPAGSSSVQSMNTTDPVNGQVRENFCVDGQGRMTANFATGGTPAAPNLSLQYNNGGVFGGSLFTYNAAVPLIQAFNADGLNFIDIEDGSVSGAGAGFTVQNAVTTHTGSDGSLANRYESYINGANTGSGGSCFVLSSATPPCANAVESRAGDTPGDTNNGQDVIVYSAIVTLNKAAGKTLNHYAEYLAATPFNCYITGCPRTVLETVGQGYGVEVQDQGGFTTSDQAAIKINSQTNPISGTKFSIEAVQGSGVAQLGDGVNFSAGITVASLPAAASNAGRMMYVTDSTAVAAEGQACVGGSTNKALAFSNGVIWKCF